jgi:hypothetical protein
MSSLLRSDVPGSLRATAVMFSSDGYWRSWGGLEAAVRTGQTAFNSILGMSISNTLTSTRSSAQRC